MCDVTLFPTSPLLTSPSPRIFPHYSLLQGGATTTASWVMARPPAPRPGPQSLQEPTTPVASATTHQAQVRGCKALQMLHSKLPFAVEQSRFSKSTCCLRQVSPCPACMQHAYRHTPVSLLFCGCGRSVGVLGADNIRCHGCEPAWPALDDGVCWRLPHLWHRSQQPQRVLLGLRHRPYATSWQLHAVHCPVIPPNR